MLTDDHEMIREGIKALIEFDSKIHVVLQANSAKDCISKLEKKDKQIDVLLLDINMPDKSGLELITEIKKINRKIKILLLTVHKEIEYLIEALDKGVNGYILKDSPSSELIKAINIIYNNEEYIQPELIPFLNSALINIDEDRIKVKSLTKRELEVLIFVAKGNFNKDIAISLNISERTVKNHISNIFRKIDVEDRTQAAVFAIKNNLIKI